MSTKFRANRKVTDHDIIRLNSVGLSLGTMANKLGCHLSTISQRLDSLGISPGDTRRSFMEDVYNNLSSDQQAWLENQLGPHISIKQFVQSLLVAAYVNTIPGNQNAA